MSKPHVFVCNPRKNKIDPKNPLDVKVHAAMMQATQGDCITTWGEPRKGEGSPICSMSSVLNFNFNCCWTIALNMRKKYKIDYFAMIHADVTAQAGWVDIGVSELQRTGADRINVLMPYKDERGCSQVAMGRPDFPRGQAMPKSWAPRRLTMDEAYQLPKTFGEKEVWAWDPAMQDRIMLVDNGLWVCDFTRPWADARNPDKSTKFHFSQCDGIFWNEDTQEYKAELLGEDYQLSYLLHDMGCKSLVTRKVLAWHHEPDGNPYPNNCVWGKWKRDPEFFGDPSAKEPPKVEVA